AGFALRSAAGRRPQVPSSAQARGVAQGKRQAVPASRRRPYRRDRLRRADRDEAAALRSRRSPEHRRIHRELQRIAMNKGLLSVDEALERLLTAARPVAETESVPT